MRRDELMQALKEQFISNNMMFTIKNKGVIKFRFKSKGTRSFSLRRGEIKQIKITPEFIIFEIKDSVIMLRALILAIVLSIIGLTLLYNLNPVISVILATGLSITSYILSYIYHKIKYYNQYNSLVKEGSSPAHHNN
ncbi:UbiA family prenyltransferase [Saccharicrinis aurantiacus]|uniref:UbiA family prenyltransferase n=1 Tax=Saccharicrinis aurantiacus TaxID=1849719 RepID=UPI00094FCE08|nr:UbiA family prenyltransferase [Saccharicrinis aurantiacus]